MWGENPTFLALAAQQSETREEPQDDAAWLGNGCKLVVGRAKEFRRIGHLPAPLVVIDPPYNGGTCRSNVPLDIQGAIVARRAIGNDPIAAARATRSTVGSGYQKPFRLFGSADVLTVKAPDVGLKTVHQGSAGCGTTDGADLFA